jgi:hypothetical protein
MQISFIRMFQVISAVLVVGLALSAASPQEAQAPEKEAKKKNPSVTVSGCLQQGQGADTFSITGEDGKKYDLSSGRVPLKNHVGHKVTVKGVQRSKQDDTAQVRVMSLKMVSKTCE